jgi:cytochrome c oxidase assembly protein subunit 15
MGCPDWPKCFGKLVPPTHVEELPDDYKEHYAEFRAKKNVRFAQLLDNIGFDELASNILNDPEILIEADFNAAKTWTEYINRLIGALAGLFILLTFFFSLSIWSVDPSIPIVMGITILVTAFQGWLGSIVVSTNLLAGLVNLHMFIAFIIVGLVLYVYWKLAMQPIQKTKRFPFNGLIIFCLFLLLVQVFFGVQVRELVDMVAKEMNYTGRGSWLTIVGERFYLHRSFSLFVLAFNVFTVWKIKTSGWMNERARNIGYTLLVLIIMEAMLGAIMFYFAIPGFAQPLHLIVAVLIFSAQFILLLHFNVQSGIKSMAL